MQCRGEWKLARVDSNPGMCARGHPPCAGEIYCGAPRSCRGELPLAPTATRCNPWCILSV
ncbi:MAG: hypothetical protein K2G49_11125 [Muribaculum sp.]|nr:hypothetical protein [Muribaculum sp.]